MARWNNVADYILEQMEPHENRIAQIEFETGESLRFGDIQHRVKQFARYLNQIGLNENDVICLCAKNRIEFAWVLLGALYVKATCLLISPDVKPREMEHILGLANPKMVFASSLTPEQQSVLKKFESIRECIYIDNILFHDGTEEFIRSDNCNGDSTAIILTSSGSTGMPKGVMLSHNNIITVLKNSGKFVSDDDTFFGLLPFHHAFGLVIMLHGLCEGSQVVTMAKFQWEKYIKAIAEYQATVLFLVPSLLVSLGKNDNLTVESLKSVKRIFTGASQINSKYQEIMNERFPQIELYHSYGMTETCFVTFFGKYRRDKAGSCGILVPDLECKLLSASGTKSKCGELGELCFKGPSVMKGYMNNTQATKESIDEEGWLQSGDIGYFDEDGYYFVKERIKEIIKYQGHQISPSEIESVLVLHKSVAEAAVVGVPDPHYGELPRAYVVKTDSNVTEEELVKFVDVELSSPKRLRGGVCFIKSLPKTVSGKILRRELRDIQSEKVM